MTRDDVQQWIDRYVDAWRSSGTAKLAGIFSDNIAYSLSPWRPALQGLSELEKHWERSRSGPDEEFELHNKIVAIDGKTAVVRVEVDYANDDPAHWRDLWIVTFDDNGLCCRFEEWPFAQGQADGQDNAVAG
jgi:hypothetical protein